MKPISPLPLKSPVSINHYKDFARRVKRCSTLWMLMPLRGTLCPPAPPRRRGRLPASPARRYRMAKRDRRCGRMQKSRVGGLARCVLEMNDPLIHANRTNLFFIRADWRGLADQNCSLLPGIREPGWEFPAAAKQKFVDQPDRPAPQGRSPTGGPGPGHAMQFAWNG